MFGRGRYHCGFRASSLAVLGQDPILGPYAENRTVDTWTWSLQLTQPLWTLPPFFAYGAAQAAVKAANWRVDEAKAQYAPSLALIASYGTNATSGSLTTPDNYALEARAWAAGVQVRVPVFTGGATYAGTQIATARNRQAVANLRAARQKAQTAARVAFDGIWAERAQAKAWDLSVRAGAKALTGARIGYRLGTRTDLDVLTALRTLYRAKRRYAQARYRMLLAGLALKAAVGALAETDIRGINALLTGSSTSPRAPRPHHG